MAGSKAVLKNGATQRTLDALLQDEQRLKAKAGAKGAWRTVPEDVNFYEDDDSSPRMCGLRSDRSELEPEAPVDDLGNALAHLRRAFTKIRITQKGFARGVKRSHLDGAYSGKRFDARMDDMTQDFIGQVLRSVPLMVKSTNMMQKLHEPLFSDQPLDRVGFVNLGAKMVHEVKMATAQTCWYDHVRPLREEVQERKLRHKSIEEQYKEARSAYLEEVTTLRATQRPMRPDPESWLAIKQTDDPKDVKWFYEPTAYLSEDERKFALDVVKEKIKMIFEVNPEVAQQMDFGQVDNMLNRVESDELAQVRRVLKNKNAELQELKKVLKDTQKGHAPSSKGSGAGKYAPQSDFVDQVISSLEQKLEDCRTELCNEQHSLESTRQELEELQGEFNQMQDYVKSETVEKAALHSQLQLLCDERDGLAEQLDELKKTVRDQATKIKTLEKDAVRLRKLGKDAKESTGKDSKDNNPSPPRRRTIVTLALLGDGDDGAYRAACDAAVAAGSTPSFVEKAVGTEPSWYESFGSTDRVLPVRLDHLDPALQAQLEELPAKEWSLAYGKFAGKSFATQPQQRLMADADGATGGTSDVNERINAAYTEPCRLRGPMATAGGTGGVKELNNASGTGEVKEWSDPAHTVPFTLHSQSGAPAGGTNEVNERSGDVYTEPSVMYPQLGAASGASEVNEQSTAVGTDAPVTNRNPQVPAADDAVGVTGELNERNNARGSEVSMRPQYPAPIPAEKGAESTTNANTELAEVVADDEVHHRVRDATTKHDEGALIKLLRDAEHDDRVCAATAKACVLSRRQLGI